MPGRSRASDRLVVEAPLAKLRKLKQLQDQYDKKVAQRRAHMDVFAQLGFVPNCKVQHAARVAGEPVPPRCGQCPQERFVDLPDEDLDVLYGGAGGGGKATACWCSPCARASGIQAFRSSGSGAAFRS